MLPHAARERQDDAPSNHCALPRVRYAPGSAHARQPYSCYPHKRAKRRRLTCGREPQVSPSFNVVCPQVHLRRTVVASSRAALRALNPPRWRDAASRRSRSSRSERADDTTALHAALAHVVTSLVTALADFASALAVRFSRIFSRRAASSTAASASRRSSASLASLMRTKLHAAAATRLEAAAIAALHSRARSSSASSASTAASLETAVRQLLMSEPLPSERCCRFARVLLARPPWASSGVLRSSTA